jgi:hypothetical protein
MRKPGGEVRPLSSVTCASVRDSAKVHWVDRASSNACSNGGTCVLERPGRGKGAEGCRYRGRVLLQFALGLLLKRRPLSAPGSFIGLPALWFAITSPNTRRPPPRCGHGVTVPPTPRSRQRGTVSRACRPKPRRRLVGRRGNHPHFVGRGSVWACRLTARRANQPFGCPVPSSKIFYLPVW